jgi:hypothetical protein
MPKAYNLKFVMQINKTAVRHLLNDGKSQHIFPVYTPTTGRKLPIYIEVLNKDDLIHFVANAPYFCLIHTVPYKT